MEDLERNILNFISKKLNIKFSELNRAQYFTSELGLSSFRAMQLICDIEDEFKVNINEADFIKLQTVGQLLDYIIAIK